LTVRGAPISRDADCCLQLSSSEKHFHPFRRVAINAWLQRKRRRIAPEAPRCYGHWRKRFAGEAPQFPERHMFSFTAFHTRNGEIAWMWVSSELVEGKGLCPFEFSIGGISTAAAY